MAFFLRFTSTPEKDLKRGSSLHMTGCDRRDFPSVREARKEFGEDVVWARGADQWAVKLGGLCGFEVESLEDGIEMGREGYGVYSGPFAVYTGRLTDDDVPEGDCFIPSGIVYKESEG